MKLSNLCNKVCILEILLFNQLIKITLTLNFYPIDLQLIMNNVSICIKKVHSNCHFQPTLFNQIFKKLCILTFFKLFAWREVYST